MHDRELSTGPVYPPGLIADPADGWTVDPVELVDVGAAVADALAAIDAETAAAVEALNG